MLWTSFPVAQRYVLGASVVAALVLVGWGTLFRRLAGHEVRTADDLCGACFEGWAVVLGVLQIWHLLLPVDARATLVVAAIGAAGLLLAARPVLAGLWRGPWRNLPVLGLGLIAAFWIAGLALGGPRHGDAGGYYIPTTLWMARFPVVVGLGNLSAPYAYNQSYFLYTAALAVGPFAARPWHLVNTAPMLMLLARGLLGWWRLVSPWQRVGWNDLAYALLLPGEIALTLGIMFTSPAPDTGIFLLGAGLLGSLLHVATGDARTARFHLLALVLFACAGWTIKVAFAGMAGALVVTAPLAWWWRFRPPGRELVDVLIGGTMIAVGMLGPWLAANIWMSGCPLFPSALGALDVPWRVRLDVQTWIESDKNVGPLSALWKSPGWVVDRLLGYGWGEREVALPLVAGAVVLPLALLRTLVRRRGSAPVPWWVLLPPVVALVFAARLTPQPRYAGAAMWIFGASAVLLAGGDWLRRNGSGRVLVASAVVAATVFLAARADPLWSTLRDFEVSGAVTTDARVLASGLTVHVPRNIEACFAAPLPCAPHPDPRLALREPGDLASGFFIDDRL